MGKAFEKRKINSIKGGAPHFQTEGRQESLPNSLIMRVMEEPEAEKEADRLSRGVTSKTPGDLMSEMGNRLGADFSDVQFHSDTLSMNRSKALGARAWAQGRDVYFGKGGFDPSVAAHELVHTVQQGAVQGDVSRSVPNGSVQLFRGEDENAIRRRVVPANASNLELMSEQRNSSIYGQRVFGDLKDPVKKLAQKSGSRIRAVNEDSGITFLYNLGERDYSGKEILRDIASREVENKDDQYDRTDEYEGFLSYMKNRTDKVGLEAASLQAGILNGPAKYQHNVNDNVNKRAYEMTAAELANDTFNPTHDTEIAQVLQKIENAHSAFEAYHRFLEYTEGRHFTAEELAHSSNWVNFAKQPIPFIKNAQGQDVDLTEGQANQHKQELAKIDKKIKDAAWELNTAREMGGKLAKGSPWRERYKQKFEDAKAKLKAAQTEKQQKGALQYRHKTGADVNTPLLKAKLKNMVRQVRDYPELKHKIGGLNIQWNQTEGAERDDTNENIMAVTTSAGAREKVTIHYDAWQDRDTPEGQQERNQINNILSGGIGHLDKVGNHELGHVLESTLNTSEEEQQKGQTSNDILQSVLPKVMDPQELSQVNYNAADGVNRYNKHIYQGQVDTTSPIFKTKKMSSAYGQSMPKEWFAEAFHDVYTKGADAKPTSIEIVKEYEKRQTEKQKGDFRKKEAGFFTRARRWFSKWWNYGRRPGEQRPAQNANANPVAAVPQQNAANVNVGPAAAVPPVNNAVNANPGGNAVGQIDANEPANADPIDQMLQANDEDVLNQSMIAVAPKKRKLKKKKKK